MKTLVATLVVHLLVFSASAFAQKSPGHDSYVLFLEKSALSVTARKALDAVSFDGIDGEAFDGIDGEARPVLAILDGEPVIARVERPLLDRSGFISFSWGATQSSNPLVGFSWGVTQTGRIGITSLRKLVPATVYTEVKRKVLRSVEGLPGLILVDRRGIAKTE